MSSTWVFLTYGTSVLLALALLYFLRAKAWYLHVLSIASALAVGLTPIPPQWNTPQAGLLIGFIFTFLFFWGLAAPFFRQRGR